MIKVFTAQDLVEVMFWANYLQQHDIPCELKNEFIGGAVGEIPPIECWPELWVNEKDEPRAKTLLESDPLAAQQDLPVWRCKFCGEESDGQFSHCWNCEAERGELITGED